MILSTGNKQGDKGFLLLEIMVSISILSLGIVLILGSLTNLLRAIEFSRDCFKAGLVLEEKMIEVYNSGAEEGSSKGVFSAFDARFSWEMDITGSADGSCKEMNLKVSWRGKNKEEELSVSTCL
ncbi:MAG: prepilin-type N-terminal cleavage/methylation domain-containing protein [Candidatus Omnitrophota bacterium]|jgi:type II secretion system protein I